MGFPGGAAAKRIVLEIVGWVLVVAGIAALVLPGPGLLMLAAGLVVLSQEYEWAERRVEPIKKRALRGAAEGLDVEPVAAGAGHRERTRPAVVAAHRQRRPCGRRVVQLRVDRGGRGVGVRAQQAG